MPGLMPKHQADDSLARPKKKRCVDAEPEYESDKARRKAERRAAREAAEAVAEGEASVEEEVDDDKAARKAKRAAKRAAREKKAESEASAPSAVADDEDLPAFASFAETPFAPAVLKAMASAGFTVPTEIQGRAWPVVLGGNDLIAVAKTGSGKTLGFLLPAFHAFAGRKADGKVASPLALVLAPTRELAQQIQVECEKFGSIVGCSSVCLFGGVPIPPQLNALKEKPLVVVGTPGRLVDIMERGSISLGNAAYVVLDEADRMLDMGFEPQIKKVFESVPAKRQTLLFSATWPKSVRKLAAAFLRDGSTTQLFVGAGADAELEANTAVTQTFVWATDDEKDKKLYDFLCTLAEKPNARVVVFANTKRRVDYLCKFFYNEGFGTCSIHGDKQQRERDEALGQFVRHEAPIMFATDVAARGLDIKGVTHVVNFDMARDVESYVHRIGRTGRAGELGESVTFWNPDYDKDCSPALVKIAKDAGQVVPDWLEKFEKTKASKAWKLENAVLPPVE